MRKNCFIASTNINLRILVQYLSNHYNLDSQDSTRLTILENKHALSLVDEISKADFIFAVIIGAQKELSNVYIEIGMGIALRKPIFAIYDIDSNKIPPYQTIIITQIKSKSIDTEILDYSLPNFLDALENKKSMPPVKNHENSKAIKLQQSFLQRISNLKMEKASARVYEALIGEIFHNLNINSINRAHSAQEISDFTVWVDDLDTYFKNPILVELVIIPGDRVQILEEKRYQLKSFLKKSLSDLGLIIYVDSFNRTFTPPDLNPPLVLYFSIEEFVKKLTTDSLKHIVLEERNLLVHS